MSTAVCELKYRAQPSEQPAPERAGTLMDRSELIKGFLSQGVPLHAIESYLDWLDSVGGDRRCPPTLDELP